ncbi:type II toxin-antitoxin system VapC family toxin [Cyanobium sp. Aljojuca 7D2]|uniref:type II toxin-antitoxin system VapC family toxin n=1 Tax=Cyanobium sp. Aljojuca 7D2 TaxID=2823698 RepID=UPI0020CC3D03|nr:type II toxin-antitoxin system VapC family toxin [Cyanobium sp. Aljojuca 7D2]MCP9891241.1 type II toxin-antitoxin system VapC family toxin [Cyanobium sp. Aljojuca 7D2]
MQLLLDTHTFLWAISDDPRLGSRSRERILTEASRVLLSHVSIWEIAIKHALARADMPLSAAQAIQWAEDCGFELLQLDLPHLLTLGHLPLHHRDPFDRLLVAQSISETLTLLSADQAFQAYDCPLLDARR